MDTVMPGLAKQHQFEQETDLRGVGTGFAASSPEIAPMLTERELYRPARKRSSPPSSPAAHRPGRGSGSSSSTGRTMSDARDHHHHSTNSNSNSNQLPSEVRQRLSKMAERIVPLMSPSKADRKKIFASQGLPAVAGVTGCSCEQTRVSQRRIAL